MERAWPVFFAIVVSAACCVRATHGDDSEKTPGRDQTGRDQTGRNNEILKSILTPDMKITGRWTGVIRRGVEEHTLAIDADPDDKDAYRLRFYSWTDTGGVLKAQRKARLVDGALSFDEPIKGFGVSKVSFTVLYAVRTDGKEFLLPGPNVADLETAADVIPRVAYQFQRRLAR